MSQEFISKYSTIPYIFGPFIEPATEEEVIDHFTSYIKEKCIEPITIVQYYMPEQFVDRISKKDFWRYICGFLSNKMDFELDGPYYGLEYIYIPYEEMDFKTYYCIHHYRPFSDIPDCIEDSLCADVTMIDKVVFRIYNPKIET